MGVTVLQGDCRAILQSLPADSVHCCITSPPYFGLRSYGIGTENGEIGPEPSPDEFIAVMVEVFREVRRVLRPDGTLWLNLGDSYNNVGGLNGGGMLGAGRQKVVERKKPAKQWAPGAKPKDLLMIPARVALALQADGWWLRSDIIWHKVNPMPESVRDRPTSAHEHVFLLTKSARYFYDAQAVAEAVQGLPENASEGGVLRTEERHNGSPLQRVRQGSRGRMARDGGWTGEGAGRQQVSGGEGADGPLLRIAQGAAGDCASTRGAEGAEGGRDLHSHQARVGGDQGARRAQVPLLPAEDGAAGNGSCDPSQQGRPSRRGEHRAGVQELQQSQGNANPQPALRNLRNVWSIATHAFSEAHFATFPPALVEPCIKAGTSERGCCPACGAPWGREVEREGETPREKAKARGWSAKADGKGLSAQGLDYAGGHGSNVRAIVTTGWSPSCACPPATPVPCTVLDPFGGAGTTGLVADRLQRNAILIELNPDYADMARRRIAGDQGPLLAAMSA